jgi:hypothetical protein
MTPYQVDSVLRTAQDVPASLGRADLYADAGGFRLLEFNIVSALGGLENAEVNRALLRHPALAAFTAAAGLGYVDTLARIAEVIKVECERRGAGPVPVVAIVDTPGNLAPHEKRFRFMAETWAPMGLDGIVCPLDQLETRSGRLFAEGRAVDVVYRYFLMEDLLEPDSQAMIEPVLSAAEKGGVGLISPMDAELYGNKAMLALLSDEANSAAFSADEAELIDRFVPWTRMLRAELMEDALARQGDLVLKPTLMHGGIGVVPGWTVSRDEWSHRLREGCGGPYVLQRRVVPVTESFPVAGRPGAVEPIALNWGAFLVGGAYAGMVIRGTADADVGVLGMATGARVGCCFHELG